MADIKFPYGATDHQQPAFAATLAVTTKNGITLLEPAILTGNMTVNVTLDAEQEKGSMLIVKVKTTGTETFTYGTNITAGVVTGVAGKTFLQAFIFDGVAFVAIADKFQID